MKKLISGLAVALLIGAAMWSHGGRAGAKSNPAETFRVSLDQVIRDDNLIVTRVEIETQPGSWVEVVSDKPNRGGVGTASPRPAQPAGPPRTRLTLLADHVRWEAGSTEALKFLMRIEGGSGSATMTETGAMPGGKRLADVLSVLLRPGEYPYGEATKLVTFKDVTYSLVVKRANGNKP